jgi:hypothetical protein
LVLGSTTIATILDAMSWYGCRSGQTLNKSNKLNVMQVLTQLQENAQQEKKIKIIFVVLEL